MRCGGLITHSCGNSPCRHGFRKTRVLNSFSEMDECPGLLENSQTQFHHVSDMKTLLPRCFFALGLLLVMAVPSNAFYNPKTGRWMSRDLTEERAGLNLYCVVRNEPLSSIDPLGLQEKAKPCSTCGGNCDQTKKKCKIKKGPVYDPPKGTMNYTREVSHKTAIFTFVVEFEHDPAQSLCAGCCEIREYMKWSKDGYPLNSTLWVRQGTFDQILGTKTAIKTASVMAKGADLTV
jgi:hypothetical protein